MHFDQLSRIESDTPVLRKFDFGTPKENMKRYGTMTPPEYDYSLIKVPIYIHSGTDDILVTPKSLDKFTRHMQGLQKKVYYRNYDDWDHFSVLLSQDPSIVFASVLEDMDELLASEYSVRDSIARK